MPTIECRLRETSGALKDKGAVYVEPLTYSTISERAFLAYVEKNFQVQESEVLGTISAVVKQMIVFLQIGHKVEVPGLGTFSLKMKGDVERDEDGVLQMENARYSGIHFTPGRTFVRYLWDTKFSLMSHNVRQSYTLTEEAALDVVRELSGEFGWFIVKDFCGRAGVSYSYGRKVVKGLVESGKLIQRRGGRLSLYKVP